MLASGPKNGQYREVEVDGLNEVGYGVMKFFSVQNPSKFRRRMAAVATQNQKSIHTNACCNSIWLKDLF
jgi:hypothetical protein